MPDVCDHVAVVLASVEHELFICYVGFLAYQRIAMVVLDIFPYP